MIHSKAIDVLKTFSKEELKQFDDFARSPFHNKNKNLIKLFDVLEKYHPEYEIENEKVYSKIYPDKVYNHNNMKKLMSENFIILEKFLLHLKIKKEHFVTDKYLLEEYMQRKLNELFLFKVKKINKKLGESNSPGYIFYNNSYGLFYDQYHFEDLLFGFYLRSNTSTKIPMDNLIKRSEYSLCCFLEHLSTDIHDMNALRGNKGNKFKEVIISELFSKSLDLKIFLKYISDNKIKNDFIVLQINLILMIIEPENEIYFKQAKHLMLSNYNNSITKNFKFFWQTNHNRLENYCNNMTHKDKTNFWFEQGFEIFKHHIQTILNNTDKNDIKIGSTVYLNIIKVGIRLYELEWVEEFMKHNSKYLEEKDKENTYNYAKAMLEFEKQNYEVSLSYASKLILKTTYDYKMHINLLTLKCYFELSLYDAAFSLIDSSKHYLLKTDELDINMKKYFSRIFSIIYKLLKLKINSDNNVKSDLLNLKSEILNDKGILQKWCLQKVEDLEKSILIKSLPQKLKKSQNKKHLKSA